MIAEEASRYHNPIKTGAIEVKLPIFIKFLFYFIIVNYF